LKVGGSFLAASLNEGLKTIWSMATELEKIQGVLELSMPTIARVVPNKKALALGWLLGYEPACASGQRSPTL
jgi:hypothetical protein